MIIHGDSLEELRKLEESSIDTIITDPPYGLSFMGKKWDYDVPSVDFWTEALRVLKPGGTLLTFAGSRTQHRMAVNIEDAGFELKDCIMWLYGSGFPKATDIKKQIDKNGDGTEWNGWKSHGLKPAYEPIIVAMKPNDGTYANNALKHGVSGLNIDGGRIEGKPRTTHKDKNQTGKQDNSIYKAGIRSVETVPPQGRFPANIILDEEAGEMLDEQSGFTKSSDAIRRNKKSPMPVDKGWNNNNMVGMDGGGYSDKGGASRFFYCAKASKKERGEDNKHPTVKPLKLMEYLCTLTKTPTGGVVLDPFAGSGTTGLACQNTGRDFILIEREEEYIPIIKARLENKSK